MKFLDSHNIDRKYVQINKVDKQGIFFNKDDQF